MKKIFKKNQIIIAALAVMIAAAGYLNYSGRIFPSSSDTEETNADLANQELLDISEEDVTAQSEDIESQEQEARGGWKRRRDSGRGGSDKRRSGRRGGRGKSDQRTGTCPEQGIPDGNHRQ